MSKAKKAYDALIEENIGLKNQISALRSILEKSEDERAGLENLLFTLAEVTEGRSRAAGRHVRRVAEYSAYIAGKLGFSEEEIRLVKMASTAHDAGKLAIPDRILGKPGKLMPLEFEMIKKHAKIGRDMLSRGERCALTDAAAAIALDHHEKFNGTGYQGKKGESTHIYGRIVAAADVFDALLMDSEYRAAWSAEDVSSYFKRESGGQFDPKIAKIVITGMDALLEIRNQYPD